jgi:hypothetical protein
MPAISPALYDPADYKIVVHGVPITGFADGTFVAVERNEDTFKLSIGANGDPVRSKSHNRSGKITVTLMQNHPDNDFLSQRAILDEQTSAAIGPTLMKHLRGSTSYNAPNSWITKMPKAEHGKEAGNIEWVIETDALEMFIGGNVPL